MHVPGTKIEWKSDEANVTLSEEVEGEPAESLFNMFSGAGMEGTLTEHPELEDKLPLVYWRLFEVVRRPVPYFTGEVFAGSDDEEGEDDEAEEDEVDEVDEEEEWETDDGEEEEEEEDDGPEALDVQPKA